MVSDDRQHVLTVIAFLGSVFSPAYAAARGEGPTTLADPLRFAALNVALHGPGGAIWVQNEGLAVQRDRDTLDLGGSIFRATTGGLRIDLDTRQTRFFGRAGARVTGRIELEANIVGAAGLMLAPGQPWYPVMPRGRATVHLETPGVTFSGAAYHDANVGAAPLSAAFQGWQWVRSQRGEGAQVLYRGRRADGTDFDVALAWDPDGRCRPREQDWTPWRRTGWGLRRDVPNGVITRNGATPRTLLDAPFYARMLLNPEDAAIHETVDLRRFERAWVQHLLTYRTHRVTAGNTP